ncbi:MAG: hypothetical protein ACI4SZ_05225, partial [Lachnospiraceae bacterium]
MKRKMLASLLVLTMVGTGLVGCGNSASETTTEAPKESATETKQETAATETAESEAETETASKYQTTYGSKMFDDVTITVELFDRSNAPDGSTITDNRWTKYAQEQMAKVGINVEYVPVSRWDEVTKMQTMVASQTAPDLTIT